MGVTSINCGKKWGFRLDQASEGLCTEQMLSFLENGKRAAPKLLQDALLERLGVGAEDYEYYLHYKEYDRWEARQRILHCITYELAERAVQLLEQYRITYITEDEEGDLNVRNCREIICTMHFSQGRIKNVKHSLNLYKLF